MIYYISNCLINVSFESPSVNWNRNKTLVISLDVYQLWPWEIKGQLDKRDPLDSVNAFNLSIERNMLKMEWFIAQQTFMLSMGNRGNDIWMDSLVWRKTISSICPSTERKRESGTKNRRRNMMIAGLFTSTVKGSRKAGTTKYGSSVSAFDFRGGNDFFIWIISKTVWWNNHTEPVQCSRCDESSIGSILGIVC